MFVWKNGGDYGHNTNFNIRMMINAAMKEYSFMDLLLSGSVIPA